MVGSHYVQSCSMPVHAAGRTNPLERGLSVGSFSPVRLDDPSAVENLVQTCREDVVVNFAARTDVDRIEQERTSEPVPTNGGEAWRVNALAPEAMARGAHRTGKYFLQVSTDFVFDGTAGPYSETDLRSPFSHRVSWYGWTKSEGERRVQQENPEASIVRISYPYRSSFPAKLDFARGMMARRQAGKLPAFYADQVITPTWVPDVTRAVATLVQTRAAGVFHAASPDPTTPYDFARQLFERAPGEAVSLQRGSLGTVLQAVGATPRPVKGGLQCHRLPHLGVRLTGWREGIDLLIREEGWA